MLECLMDVVFFLMQKGSYERGRRGGGSNNYMIFDDDYVDDW